MGFYGHITPGLGSFSNIERYIESRATFCGKDPEERPGTERLSLKIDDVDFFLVRVRAGFFL
jgi:hypothetical protein